MGNIRAHLMVEKLKLRYWFWTFQTQDKSEDHMLHLVNKFPSFHWMPVAIAQPEFEPLDHASIQGNRVISYSHAMVWHKYLKTNSSKVLALCHNKI